jgi:hypothetical protein
MNRRQRYVYQRQTTRSLESYFGKMPKSCEDEGYYTSWCEFCRDYTSFDNGACTGCDTCKN